MNQIDERLARELEEMRVRRERMDSTRPNCPFRAKKKKRKKGRPERAPRPPQRALAYSEYRKSAWWVWRERKAIRRAQYRCVECGEKNELKAHHLSHQRLGQEANKDLRVLCRACYERANDWDVQANAHLDGITS